MAESFCQLGDVRLCYETFGDPEDAPLLLIMGLGTQMVAWSEPFCEALAERGFFVIRYDNRDIGKSTKFSSVRPPTLRELVTRRVRTAYTLEDMADDAVGLLSHLDIDKAHIVGASMGGMIAQTVAVRHPDRVLSLTSIMSTTGTRLAGQPALSILPLFLSPAPRDRDAYVERAVALFSKVGSVKAFPDATEHVRELALRQYERGLSAAGTGRQLAAIIGAGNRTRAVKAIRAPTLVIHGTADKLVAPSGGKATASSIPGARLELIEGMGHDLPRALYPRLVGLIADHAHAAAPEPALT